jgi:hypothetical protein
VCCRQTGETRASGHRWRAPGKPGTHKLGGRDQTPDLQQGRFYGLSLPRLRELPGFGGYYLIDAGGGVLTSVGLFETSAQAHESTRLAARWVREQKLEDALPNTPKITAGPVIAREAIGAAVANGVAALA